MKHIQILIEKWEAEEVAFREQIKALDGQGKHHEAIKLMLEISTISKFKHEVTIAMIRDMGEVKV